MHFTNYSENNGKQQRIEMHLMRQTDGDKTKRSIDYYSYLTVVFVKKVLLTIQLRFTIYLVKGNKKNAFDSMVPDHISIGYDRMECTRNK